MFKYIIFIGFLFLSFLSQALLENYVQHLGNLDMYLSKIRAQEERAEEILQNRKNNPEQSQALLTELSKIRKELVDLQNKYDKELQVVKYRFPEKEAEIDKRYYQSQSLQKEHQQIRSTLDEKLNSLTQSVRKALDPHPERYEGNKRENQVLTHSEKDRHPAQEEKAIKYVK